MKRSQRRAKIQQNRHEWDRATERRRDTVNHHDDVRQVASAELHVAYLPVMVAGTNSEAIGAPPPVLRFEDPKTGVMVEQAIHRFPPTSWELCPSRSQFANCPVVTKKSEAELERNKAIERLLNREDRILRKLAPERFTESMSHLEGAAALP